MSSADKTLKGMSSMVQQLLETARARMEVAQAQERVASAQPQGGPCSDGEGRGAGCAVASRGSRIGA